MVRARSKQAAENDIKLQAAVDRLADSTYSTIYSAAKHLSLSHKTLRRCIARGKSYAQAREDAQYLSKAEEKSLVRWALMMLYTSHPIKYRFLREIAEEIQ